MNKLLRKAASIAMAAAMSITMVGTLPVRAEILGVGTKLDIPIEYITYASMWAEMSYSIDVEISDTVQVVDINGNPAGFMISFSYNDVPMGYIIVDLSCENPLKEYAYEGESLYEALSDNATNIAKSASMFSESINDKRMICLSPLYYAVEIGNGMVSVNGEIQTDDELVTFAEELADNEALYLSSGVSTTSISGGMVTTPPGTLTNSHNITNLKNYTPISTSNFTVGNNCKFVASTNIFNYFQKCRGKNMLTTVSGMEAYDATYLKIEEYREDLGDMPSAIEQYMVDRGFSNAYTVDHGTDSSILSIKTDIDNNAPVLIYISRPSGESGSNHAVVGCAYQVRKDKTTSSITYYIRIMDGWNNNFNRFIAWNNDYYSSLRGIGVYYE